MNCPKQILFIVLLFSMSAVAQKDSRKSYLEDIFIWKISDELKLSVPEEKKFGEIQKDLNKRKQDLNKSIQSSIDEISDSKIKSESEFNKKLQLHRKLLVSYNQLTIEEFDRMKNLLGPKRLLNYLKIKNDLTNKVKSLLAGESEKKESGAEKGTVVLPPPKITVED